MLTHDYCTWPKWSQFLAGSDQQAACASTSAPAVQPGRKLAVTPDASPTQQRLELELIEKDFSDFR